MPLTLPLFLYSPYLIILHESSDMVRDSSHEMRNQTGPLMLHRQDPRDNGIKLYISINRQSSTERVVSPIESTLLSLYPLLTYTKIHGRAPSGQDVDSRLYRQVSQAKSTARYCRPILDRGSKT